MATNLDEDAEELMTCIVCLQEYNDSDRKPKFLSCSHSICLKCSQTMELSDKFSCPMCRKITLVPSGGVGNLPNNVYALFLLKIKHQLENEEKSTLLVQTAERNDEKNTLVPGRLCLSCMGMAKLTCGNKSHNIFDADSHGETRKDANELRGLIESFKSCLLEAVAERNKMDSFCQQVLDYLKMFEDGLRQQVDGNDLRLAELVSVLEMINTWDKPV